MIKVTIEGPQGCGKSQLKHLIKNMVIFSATIMQEKPPIIRIFDDEETTPNKYLESNIKSDMEIHCVQTLK